MALLFSLEIGVFDPELIKVSVQHVEKSEIKKVLSDCKSVSDKNESELDLAVEVIRNEIDMRSIEQNIKRLDNSGRTIHWVSINDTPERLGQMIGMRFCQKAAMETYKQFALMRLKEFHISERKEEIKDYCDILIDAMSRVLVFEGFVKGDITQLIRDNCNMERSSFKVIVEDEWKEDFLELVSKSFGQALIDEMSIYSEDLEEGLMDLYKNSEEKTKPIEDEDELIMRGIRKNYEGVTRVKLDDEKVKKVIAKRDLETNDIIRKMSKQMKMSLRRMKDGLLFKDDFEINAELEVKINFKTVPDVTTIIENGFIKMSDINFMNNCYTTCSNYMRKFEIISPFNEDEISDVETKALVKTLALDVEERFSRANGSYNGFKCLFELLQTRLNRKLNIITNEKISKMVENLINCEESAEELGLYDDLDELRRLLKTRMVDNGTIVNTLGRVKGLVCEIMISLMSDCKRSNSSSLDLTEYLIDERTIGRVKDIDFISAGTKFRDFLTELRKCMGLNDDFKIETLDSKEGCVVEFVELGCKTRYQDKCESDMNKLKTLVNGKGCKIALCFRSIKTIRRAYFELKAKGYKRMLGDKIMDFLSEIGILSEDCLREITQSETNKVVLVKAAKELGDKFINKLSYSNCIGVTYKERNELITMNTNEVLDKLGMVCKTQRDMILNKQLVRRAVNESVSQMDIAKSVSDSVSSCKRRLDSERINSNSKKNEAMVKKCEETLGRMIDSDYKPTSHMKNDYELKERHGFESVGMLKGCLEELIKDKRINDIQFKEMKRLGDIDCEGVNHESSVIDEEMFELSTNCLLVLDNVYIKMNKMKVNFRRCVSTMIRLLLIYDNDYDAVKEAVIESFKGKGKSEMRISDSYRNIHSVNTALVRTCNTEAKYYCLMKSSFKKYNSETLIFSRVFDWYIVEDVMALYEAERYSCLRLMSGVVDILKETVCIYFKMFKAFNSFEKILQSGYKALLVWEKLEGKLFYESCRISTKEKAEMKINVDEMRADVMCHEVDKLMKAYDDRRSGDEYTVMDFIISTVITKTSKLSGSKVMKCVWSQLLEEVCIRVIGDEDLESSKIDNNEVNSTRLKTGEKCSLFLSDMITKCLVVPSSIESIKEILSGKGMDSEAELISKCSYPTVKEKYIIKKELSTAIEIGLERLFPNVEEDLSTERIIKHEVEDKAPKYIIFKGESSMNTFEVDNEIDKDWLRTTNRILGLDDSEIGKEMESDMKIINEKLCESNEYRKLFFERAVAKTIVAIHSDKVRRRFEIMQVKGYKCYLMMMNGNKARTIFTFVIIDEDGNCTSVIRLNEQKLSFLLSSVSMVQSICLNQIDSSEQTVEGYFKTRSSRKLDYSGMLKEVSFCEIMCFYIGTDWVDIIYLMFCEKRNRLKSEETKLKEIIDEINKRIEFLRRTVILDDEEMAKIRMISNSNDLIEFKDCERGVLKLKESVLGEKILNLLVIKVVSEMVLEFRTELELRTNSDFDGFKQVFLEHTLKVMKENNNEVNEQMQKTRFIIMHRNGLLGSYLGYGKKLYTSSRKAAVSYNRLQEELSLIVNIFDSSGSYLMTQTDMVNSTDLRKSNNEMYLNQYFCKMLVDFKQSLRAITWKVAEKVVEWDNEIQKNKCKGGKECYCDNKESDDRKTVMNCLFCLNIYEETPLIEEIMYCVTNQNKFASASPKMTSMMTSSYINNNFIALDTVFKESKNLEKHDLISMCKSTGMVESIVKLVNTDECRTAAADRVAGRILSRRIGVMRSDKELETGMIAELRKYTAQRAAIESNKEIKEGLIRQLNGLKDESLEVESNLDWNTPLDSVMKMNKMRSKLMPRGRNLKNVVAYMERVMEQKTTERWKVFHSNTIGIRNWKELEEEVEERMKAIVGSRDVKTIDIDKELLNNNLNSYLVAARTLCDLLTSKEIRDDGENKKLFPEDAKIVRMEKKTLTEMIRGEDFQISFDKRRLKTDSLSIREETESKGVIEVVEECCFRAYAYEVGFFERLHKCNVRLSSSVNIIDEKKRDIDEFIDVADFKKNLGKANDFYLLGGAMTDKLQDWINSKGDLFVPDLKKDFSLDRLKNKCLVMQSSKVTKFTQLGESLLLDLDNEFDLPAVIDKITKSDGEGRIEVVFEERVHEKENNCYSFRKIIEVLKPIEVNVECSYCQSFVRNESEDSVSDMCLRSKEVMRKNMEKMKALYESTAMVMSKSNKNDQTIKRALRSGCLTSFDIFNKVEILEKCHKIMTDVRAFRSKYMHSEDFNRFCLVRDLSDLELMKESKQIKKMVSEYNSILNEMMNHKEKNKKFMELFVNFCVEAMSRSMYMCEIRSSGPYLVDCDIGAYLGLRHIEVADSLTLYFNIFRNDMESLKNIFFGKVLRVINREAFEEIMSLSEPCFTLILFTKYINQEVRKSTRLRKLNRGIKGAKKDKVAFLIAQKVFSEGKNSYVWNLLIDELRKYNKETKEMLRHQTTLAPKNQLGGPRDLVVQTLKSAMLQSCVEVIGKDAFSVYDNNSLSSKSCKKRFMDKIIGNQKERKFGSTEVYVSKDGESWGPKMKGGHIIGILSMILRSFGYENVSSTLDVCGVIWDNRETEIDSKIVEDMFVRLQRFDTTGRTIEDVCNMMYVRKEEETQRYIMKKLLNKEKYITMFNHMGQGLLQCTSTGIQALTGDFLRKELIWIMEGDVKFDKICGSDDSLEIIRVKNGETKLKTNEKIKNNCDWIRILTSSLNVNDSSKSCASEKIAEYHSEFISIGRIIASKCKFMSGMLTTSDTSDIFKIIESTYSMLRQGLENGMDMFDLYSALYLRFCSIFGICSKAKQNTMMEILITSTMAGGFTPFELVSWSTSDKSDFSEDLKLILCHERFEKRRYIEDSDKVTMVLEFLRNQKKETFEGKFFRFRNQSGNEKRINELIDMFGIGLEKEKEEFFKVLLGHCRVLNMRIDSLRMSSILTSLKRDGSFSSKSVSEVRESIFRMVDSNSYSLRSLPVSLIEEIKRLRELHTFDVKKLSNKRASENTNWKELKEACLAIYNKNETEIVSRMNTSIANGMYGSGNSPDHCKRFRMMRRIEINEKSNKILGINSRTSLFDTNKRFLENEAIVVIAWNRFSDLVREAEIKNLDENSVRDDLVRLKLKAPELLERGENLLASLLNKTSEEDSNNLDEIVRKLNRPSKLLYVFVDMRRDKYQDIPRLFYESSSIKGVNLNIELPISEYCLNTPRGLAKEVIGFVCSFTDSSFTAIELIDCVLNKKLSDSEASSFGIKGTIMNNLEFSTRVGDRRFVRTLEDLLKRGVETKFTFSEKRTSGVIREIQSKRTCVLRGGSRMKIIETETGCFICGPSVSSIDLENGVIKLLRMVCGEQDVERLRKFVRNRSYSNVNTSIYEFIKYVNISEKGNVYFSSSGMPYFEIEEETESYNSGKNVDVLTETKTIRKRNGFEIVKTDKIIVSDQERTEMFKNFFFNKETDVELDKISTSEKIIGSRMFGEVIMKLCLSAFKERGLKIKPRKKYEVVFCSSLKAGSRLRRNLRSLEGDEDQVEEISMNLSEIFEREEGFRSEGSQRVESRLELREESRIVLRKVKYFSEVVEDKKSLMMAAVRNTLTLMINDNNYIKTLKMISPEEDLSRVVVIDSLSNACMETILSVFEESYDLLKYLRVFDVTSKAQSTFLKALSVYETSIVKAWYVIKDKLRAISCRKKAPSTVNLDKYAKERLSNMRVDRTKVVEELNRLSVDELNKITKDCKHEEVLMRVDVDTKVDGVKLTRPAVRSKLVDVMNSMVNFVKSIKKAFRNYQCVMFVEKDTIKSERSDDMGKEMFGMDLMVEMIKHNKRCFESGVGYRSKFGWFIEIENLTKENIVRVEMKFRSGTKGDNRLLSNKRLLESMIGTSKEVVEFITSLRKMRAKEISKVVEEEAEVDWFAQGEDEEEEEPKEMILIDSSTDASTVTEGDDEADEDDDDFGEEMLEDQYNFEEFLASIDDRRYEGED